VDVRGCAMIRVVIGRLCSKPLNKATSSKCGLALRELWRLGFEGGFVSDDESGNVLSCQVVHLSYLRFFKTGKSNVGEQQLKDTTHVVREFNYAGAALDRDRAQVVQ
jgi:hypothetical protein